MLLLLLSALACCSGPRWVSAAPGYLDFDNLPETGFSCEGKVIGGYYADIETGCQMFHVCTVGQKGEVMDIKFLCLNGTVFDQETRVCERVDEVDCSKTEGFYDLNLELYGAHGFSSECCAKEWMSAVSDNEIADQGIHEEDSDEEVQRAPTVPPSSSSSTTTTSTTTSTTTTTTTTTTTPRPTPSFPSTSSGAVALLAIHNSFSGVRPHGAELRTPSADLQPPTAPTYTLRQQHHPHGVAHTYFSNTPRPFQFFERRLGSPTITPGEPTVIATSRTMTSSVSHPARTHTPPPTSPPPTEPTAPDDDEEYVDYALQSFYKDVPKVDQSQSVSLSVSTSSSSTKPIIVAHRAVLRSKRQSRRGNVRQRKPAPVAQEKEEIVQTETPPSSTTPSIPQTSFTCADKIPGGFYADVEADCKVFHICAQGRHNKINDHKFVCGVGTKFDQESRTCVAQEIVRCKLAPSLYHLNDHFLVPKPDELLNQGVGFESQKIRGRREIKSDAVTHRRNKRQSNKKNPPNYKLNTLPAATDNFACPTEDGLFADAASECQAYHQCASQTHSVHICPHPTVFNEALGVCDQWENVDCELYLDGHHDSQRTRYRPKRAASAAAIATVATSECNTARKPVGTPIPDETTGCRAYHLCVFSEGQLVRLQMQCPAGRVMHPEKHRCVRGNTCQEALASTDAIRRVFVKRSSADKKPVQPLKKDAVRAANKEAEAALGLLAGDKAPKLLEKASGLGAVLEAVAVETDRRRPRDLDELAVQKYAPDKPSRLDEFVEEEDEEAEAAVVTTAPEQRVLEATDLPPESTTATPPPSQEFSCRGRRLEAFHANPWDCRLFHMCAPSEAGRLLNLRFACGAGAVFEEASQKCVPRTFCLR